MTPEQLVALLAHIARMEQALTAAEQHIGQLQAEVARLTPGDGHAEQRQQPDDQQ